MKLPAVLGYEAAADELVPRFEAFDTGRLLAPVLPFFPVAPGRLLDLGAGTGRDAAWFAARGWQVLAVEPVEAFRAAGAARHGAAVAWLDDALPDLVRIVGPPFDAVLCNGVWHHLEPGARCRAWLRLRFLVSSRGIVVLTLRHGPAPAGRPGYPICTAQTLAEAEGVGFRLRLVESRASLQPGNRAAGVSWTWLVLAAA